MLSSEIIMNRRNAIRTAITSLVGIVLAIPRMCKAIRRDKVETLPTRLNRPRFEKDKDGYDICITEQLKAPHWNDTMHGMRMDSRVLMYYGVEPYFLATYTNRPHAPSPHNSKDVTYNLSVETAHPLPRYGDRWTYGNDAATS